MSGDRGLSALYVKRDEEPEIIRFYSSKFECFTVHWIDKRINLKERSKIEKVYCNGVNCRLCLSGSAPSLRFSAVVKHDGEQKELEIPRKTYLDVLQLIGELGRDQFRKTDLHISRQTIGGGFAEYVIEVPDAS